MNRLASLLFVLAAACCVAARGDETVGRRPYEMVWANRTTDVRPPLVDFENLDGWTAARVDAAASFSRSRQQQLWGQYVGALVYRGTGQNPKVSLKPPKPILVAGPFNCVHLWVYGNNWSFDPDPKTPPVEIAVLLRGRGGAQVRVVLGPVGWQQWSVMHRRLTDEQSAPLREGASVEAIEVSGGRNPEDRRIYFDNLAVYQEPLAPLKFEPRPARPFDPCPDGTPGLYTGPGQLPFPTRPETILPDNLTTEFKTNVERSGNNFAFHYRGKDAHLVYRYTPTTGGLGDLTAQWEGRGGPFQPLAGGGIGFYAEQNKPAIPPEKMELVRCRQDGNAVQAAWRCTAGKRTAELQYTFELLQKSLLITVRCPGGQVGEFRVGKAVALDNPRLIPIPFLMCDQSRPERPAVVVVGPAEKPLFLSAFLDYYMSNASDLWADNLAAKDGVVYNGGSHYLPKTDGRRNTCYERLFLTVSPRFEEMLPTVANPRSPWMHVAGERLWIAHGATDRQKDYALWKEVDRYGMTKLVITDHESGWRDEGESFTLRTRTAPGRGGDPSQADYARKLHALGFRYGIYNNYTDFAPVNEFWSEDRVTRLPDGQWRTAWPRCYNLKAASAVELEAKLAPAIQEKFHLDTAYCDVHTSVPIWWYTDFDARVPRAGTFAGTFYAYGEILLHQQKTWNGPAYSEGGNHWYYCGLTDGNYGQDQAARLDVNPWLVDFDLRKLHPLCCNFGMGSPGMFFGYGQGLGSSPQEQEARLDRFLAATLAFGHTGFLVLDGGMATAVRSYFSVQQVHAAYAQATVAEIRYADAQGRLLDTSAAVATDAFRRSQIVTRYDNGLVVSVNGHPTETWKTPEMTLPPNGWHVKDTRDGKLTAWSALIDGHRADYVDSPAYLYANGRGRLMRFQRAACNGQLVVHKRAGGSLELVPLAGCTEFGVSWTGKLPQATALDAEGKPRGPATTQLKDGLIYVTPVPKAFSYILLGSIAQ
jgi:hypothetical protein